MSLSIDEYLSSISALQTALQQSSRTTSDTVRTSSGDGDSYIASAAGSSGAIPSENYNDILKVIQSAKADSSGTSTSSESLGETEEAVSGGASGGGGDSGSEEETTTKVVTINGVTYLETTTTTDGVTTTTRTVISGSSGAAK